MSAFEDEINELIEEVKHCKLTKEDLPYYFYNEEGDMIEVIIAFPEEGEYATRIDDMLTIYRDEKDNSKITKYDIKSFGKLWECHKLGIGLSRKTKL